MRHLFLLLVLFFVGIISVEARTSIDAVEILSPDTISVSGTAPPRRYVTVAGSWRNTLRRTRADHRGDWKIALPLPEVPDTAEVVVRITATDDINFDSDSRPVLLRRSAPDANH